ncbi:MAG: hypothetical protein Q7R49_01655 [Candidatus Daviesbacteria bacterium]|nr:hypothetical protein [Candidatus Daviesbacteria bacterium]
MLNLEPLTKVALVTFFFSFGIQMLFFLYWKMWDSKFIAKYNHVFSYFSGVIGDGLLVPLINVFAVMTISTISANMLMVDLWVMSFITGFLITLAFHWGQEHFDLKNWTMPEPGQWNLLGAYHSLFMFFETSFLFYGLVSYIRYLVTNGPGSLMYSPIRFALMLFFLFFLTFVFDYRHSIFKKFYTYAKDYIFSSRF